MSEVNTTTSILAKKPKLATFNVRQYAMIAVLIIVWIIFSIITQGTFISPRNLSNLTRATTIVSSLALGVFLVIVSGNIDLSLGSVCGLIGGVAAIFNVWLGISTPIAIALALLIGITIGLINGYLVAYQNIPAFIVTLGGLMLYRGVLMGITRGITVSPLDKSFAAIGQSYIPSMIGYSLAAIAIFLIWVAEFRSRASRTKYGFNNKSTGFAIFKLVIFSAIIVAFVVVMAKYRGIPLPVLIISAIAIVILFLARMTKFGRYVFAIGGNSEATRLSGINVEFVTMMLFVLCSFLASVGGILLTSRLNAATISAGQSYELDAIASCVIGGTSITGGEGTVLGVLTGALIMASIDNGMSLLNTESFWQYIVKGGILVLAVWFDIKTKSKKA